MPDPKFTVVVPTRDRPRALQACLEATRRLAGPHDGREVVVVDDGSRVPVESGEGWRVVRLGGQGPAAARNAGARAARGEWLAFTDDDCRPRPGWLDALAARLEANPGALVGGCTVNALTSNPWSSASQLLVDWLYAWPEARPEAGRIFTTSNLAVAREPFLAAGGFDEAFSAPGAEDRELCERWAARGGALVHAPEAVVDHEHVLDALAFWHQHVRYGRGTRRLWRRGGEQGYRHGLHPPAFYAGMLNYPFRRKRGDAWAQAALLVLAQVANVAGFASEWMEERCGDGAPGGDLLSA